MMKNPWEKDWSPGTWVLIWKYSVTVCQWIPTWQGLDGFQKSVCPFALDESSVSIRKVNPYAAGGYFGQYKMMQKKLKND